MAKHASSLEKDVRSLLGAHGLRLNKDLGQHYLIDQTILDRIVDASGMQKGEHIIEIGPGIGVLTNHILEENRTATAIELDARVIPLLQQYITKKQGKEALDRLEICNENALDVAFPESPYRIVANIPYHITSPLLRHAFLESPVPPQSLTLLIQREVGEKICDPKNGSLLSMVVRLFGEPRYVCHVPPSCFLPPPKVESSVIHIDCYPEAKADAQTIDRMLKLLKAAFAQKRKMLSNSIGTMPGGKEWMEQANIAPTRRPQTLTLDEWIHLARISMQ